MTPQEMICQSAAEVGALVEGSAEPRTDHAAVEAEIRARLENGLRVDDSIRAQLRFKYTAVPSITMSFERRVYNPATGEMVTRDDRNKLDDFNARLLARAAAEQAGVSAAVWGPGGAMNDAARRMEAEIRAKTAAAQARIAEMNAHLPPGYPR